MKTRFPKSWCNGCKSMQFSGACSHVLSVGLDRPLSALGFAMSEGAARARGEAVSRLVAEAGLNPAPFAALEVTRG